MRQAHRLIVSCMALLLCWLVAGCATGPTASALPTATLVPASASTATSVPVPCASPAASATVPSSAGYQGTSYCVTLASGWTAGAPYSDAQVKQGIKITNSGASTYTFVLTPLATKTKADCADMTKCVADWGTAYIKANYGVTVTPDSASNGKVGTVNGVAVEILFTSGGVSYNSFFTGVTVNDVVFVVNRVYPDGTAPQVGDEQAMLQSVRFY
jgi:hypothetical protein